MTPRVAVIGIGGVGGIIAASLRSAKRSEVILVARGHCLEALLQRGLLVNTVEKKTFRYEFEKSQVLSSEEAIKMPSTSPKADFIFVATKAYSLPSTLSIIKGLMGPSTTVIPCVNGLPWWYFQNLDAQTDLGPNNNAIQLTSTDPTGTLASELNIKSIVGCVCMISGHVDANYQSWNSHWEMERNTLVIGEPKHIITDRVHEIKSLFDQSSVKVNVDVVDDIKDRIFDKLLINCSINTLGALTLMSCGQVSFDFV